MNIRHCRAEVPLSVWLVKSQKNRRPKSPTLDELPFNAFARSPLSVEVKLKKNDEKIWILR
jgi:hypothetical protein